MTAQCELHWVVVSFCSHEGLAVSNRMHSAGPTGSGSYKTSGSKELLAKGMFLYDYVDIYL